MMNNTKGMRIVHRTTTSPINSSITAVSALLFCLVFLGQMSTAQESKTKSKAYRLVPPPAKFTPPVLEIEEDLYNWGIAIQGESVERTFVLKNVGGAPLIIDRIKPSCGCTTAKQPEKPIPPGGSDTVTLRIDTKNLPEKTKKSASIYSNDASSPAKVHMEGRVEPLFKIEPKLPKLVMVRGAEAEPVSIKLTRAGDTPLKVTEVKAKTPVLQPVLTEIEAGKVYTIDVTAQLDDSARKYYYEQLEVSVEAKNRTFTIPIRVSVTVKDRIDVEPRNSVYFNRTETRKLTAPGAEPLSKVLEIKSLGGEDHTFKITEIVSQGKNFTSKLETVVDGKHYRLNVLLPKLPVETTRRTINEKIILKTDDPTIEQITITALAAVK